MSVTEHPWWRERQHAKSEEELREELHGCNDGETCAECMYIRGILDGRASLRRVPVPPPFGSRWPR